MQDGLFGAENRLFWCWQSAFLS